MRLHVRTGRNIRCNLEWLPATLPLHTVTLPKVKSVLVLVREQRRRMHLSLPGQLFANAALAVVVILQFLRLRQV